MLTLVSSAFDHERAIPPLYTCDGRGVSPPLAWKGVPARARSLTLIVDDPDAPDPAAPRRVWVHWLLYNLPPSDGQLDEGVAPAALPGGACAGVNDFGRTTYGGPCPPIGRHRYVFTLHALDVVLPRLRHPNKAALEAAMKDHVLERATLIGTYERR